MTPSSQLTPEELAGLDGRYPFVYRDRKTWGRVGVSLAVGDDFVRVTMMLENKPGARWQVVDMTPQEAEQLGRRLIERASHLLNPTPGDQP